MSCSANSNLPMKIGIRIQSANTVLTQFDTALISGKSFGAVCRSTHVQAVSLDPIYIYIYIYIHIYIYIFAPRGCHQLGPGSDDPPRGAGWATAADEQM